MVHAQCDFHHVADDNIAFLVHNRSRDCGGYRKNPAFAGVDDRAEVFHVHHAHVGDREGTAGHVFRSEFAGTCLAGLFRNLVRKFIQCFSVGIADDRNDQPVVEADRDAEVYFGLVNDGVSDALGVDVREFLRASATAFAMNTLTLILIFCFFRAARFALTALMSMETVT